MSAECAENQPQKCLQTGGMKAEIFRADNGHRNNFRVLFLHVSGHFLACYFVTQPNYAIAEKDSGCRLWFSDYQLIANHVLRRFLSKVREGLLWQIISPMR